MKNPWSNSEKNYSRQMAVSYIIYMMAGSYYHKSFCRSPLAEKHMYLHYVEMPKQKQISQEEKVLRVLDKMEAAVRSGMQELQCEVLFRWDREDYVITFETGGFETMVARVEADGRFTIHFPERVLADCKRGRGVIK